MKILDAMCGNGVISKELSKKDNVELYLLDNSSFQIDLAKKSIKNAKFFVGSILNTPFENDFFDRIILRNGIHEIPEDKQEILYKELFRILKKGGLFLNWATLLTKNNREVYTDIVRMKDKIAGFRDLVKNRYFVTKEEFLELIKNSGFEKINFIDFGLDYHFSTKRWCEVDFKGNEEKLKEFNRGIRNLNLKNSGLNIKDFEEDIQIIVPAMISIAKK
jgi:ubiquinone/menaquinone biosynthesis C-methylase UbiE